MVEMNITYLGKLRCEAVHGPSGTKIITDAPVDNCGRGEAFSPTDLTCASLATCILTTMGIKAQQLDLNLEGMRAKVSKEMSSTPPRRIARILIDLHLPARVGLDLRPRLESLVQACPVHRSLNAGVHVDVRTFWDA